MPSIALTDIVGLTADLKIRDDSPLAKAGLTQILSIATNLAGTLNPPVDQTPLRTVVLGATLTAPSILIGSAATLVLSAGANARITIFKPADKSLFCDDPFAPTIAIGPDECWVEFQIDATAGGKVAGAVDGFGVGVDAAAALSLATYTLVRAVDGRFPTFVDAVAQALANYQVSCTAAAIRSQPAGTVTSAGLGGTLTFSGSYSLPVSVNALASVDLPLNQTITLNPSLTVEVAGQIALTGEFQVRSHKVSPTELHLGVYKKKGTTLTASLSAGAGLQANLGTTDLFAAVFGAVFPAVDVKNQAILGDQAGDLQCVLKQAVDRSLSIAVNVACSASVTDEAAVIYTIDLSSGDAAATDAALSAALRGDWTSVDRLPNARPLRNIVRDTHAWQHKFAISLLGIYSAVTVEEFVRSSTILHDGDGQLVITDTASASRISVAASPLLADPDKLRKALAEAFLATVTYTAAAGGGFAAALSASQTYFVYENKMTRQEMRDAVLLGRALGLIGGSEWDPILAANPVFRHARVQAAAKYDNAAALRLVVADPHARVLHTRGEMVRIGRLAMRALIDPGDPAAAARTGVLADDAAWRAMDQNGNRAQFQFLPELQRLAAADLEAVGSDWTAVAWWADSLERLGPLLVAVLSAAGSDFTDKRKKLAAQLSAVTRDTHADFVGGWGLAVMAALSGAAPSVTMDVAWDGNAQHYAR